MGEVRTIAILTNAADEAQARRGLIEESEIRSFEADALVDTGSVSTVIPPAVMDRLGLLAYDRRTVEYADGRKESVEVSEPLAIRIYGRRTTEEAVVLGNEVLIGQTVLEKTDLHVDCTNRKLAPNPEHPDEPVIKIK